MTPERQAAIRSALEQDDPERYYAMGGNRTLASARHDYDVKWELLLALEAAQERWEKSRDEVELALSVLRSGNAYRSGWGQEVYTILLRAIGVQK